MFLFSILYQRIENKCFFCTIRTFLSRYAQMCNSSHHLKRWKNSYTFDQVLAVSDSELKVGNPTVEGATVTASVVCEGKDKKVIVYKYKRKTGYHKKNGHRQLFTKVKIEKINA